MNRHEWWSFYSYVDAASEDELLDKRTEIQRRLPMFTDPDVIADAKRMLSVIERELLDRSWVRNNAKT